MFRKTWVNLCSFRFRSNMFSHFSLDQKNSLSSIMVFNNLKESLPNRCYCVKSDNLVTYPDSSHLISDVYEIEECFDSSSSNVDSKIKYTKYKDRCITKIKNVLKCSDIESLELHKKYPHMFHENICNTVEKITMLTDAGTSERSILKNIEILELDDEEIMYRIQETMAWGFDEEQKREVLALLKLESRMFRKVTCLFRIERNVIPEGNRLIYFSNIFQCSLEETVDLSLKYCYLLTRNFEEMSKLFKLLLDYGISSTYLRNNLWFTAHSFNNIKKWTDLSHVNPTLCTKLESRHIVFLNKLKGKGKHEQTLLKPNQTKEQFLAEKLQIDVKLMKYLISQYPKTFNQDLCHITRVIDFLYSHEYTNVQICTNPTILNKDIEFLQNRLEESQKMGCDKLHLSILRAQKSKYQKWLKNKF